MKALARRQSQLVLPAFLFNIQLQHSGEQPNRLVLDLVILVTQGFTFVDVEILPT